MLSLTTNSTASNIVPTANYSGGGSYTLTGLVVGVSYRWAKGANDTNCVVNGSITLTASGVFTATAVTVTLNGTNSASITALVSKIAGVVYPSTFTPTQPTKQVSIGEFPAGNPNWSRLHQISNEAHYVKNGTAQVAMPLADFTNLALAVQVGLTWTPPIILTQPVNGICAGNAAATATLTGSGSTNVADGETVTIGVETYRFKTVPLVANDIFIGGSGNSDTSLLNLIKAINGSGIAGTNYFAGTAASPQVSAAASVTSHAFAITCLATGLAGNAIVTTETSSVLSWGGGTMTGGSSLTISFTVSAGSEYDLSYQWQCSVDGVNWTNISGTTNGCPYTGFTTATLATGVPTTRGQNGVFHRCIVTDDAGLFGLTNGVKNTDGLSVLNIA